MSMKVIKCDWVIRADEIDNLTTALRKSGAKWKMPKPGLTVMLHEMGLLSKRAQDGSVVIVDVVQSDENDIMMLLESLAKFSTEGSSITWKTATNVKIRAWVEFGRLNEYGRLR